MVENHEEEEEQDSTETPGSETETGLESKSCLSDFDLKRPKNSEENLPPPLLFVFLTPTGKEAVGPSWGVL